MTLFDVSPRDPLVLRDGRLNKGQTESATVGFPNPAVLAGVIRTALGTPPGKPFNSTLIDRLLKEVSIRGPLLRDVRAKIPQLFVPAPLDSLIVESKEEQELQIYRLKPISLPTGCFTSLEQGQLVGLEPPPKDKPASKVPKFWQWNHFETWLREPADKGPAPAMGYLQGGLTALAREERVHVAIDPVTLTAKDRALFGTTGLRGSAKVWAGEADKDDLKNAEVSFEVSVEAGSGTFPGAPKGVRPMGGERRLSHWTEVSNSWPNVPAWLLEYVKQARQVRAIFLTPAFVTESLNPGCFSIDGIRVIAAKVDRPETISGWDFAKGKPKASKRLVSAGSVYWIELPADPGARKAWVEKNWFTNMGDDAQDCRNGLGLVVFGRA